MHFYVYFSFDGLDEADWEEDIGRATQPIVNMSLSVSTATHYLPVNIKRIFKYHQKMNGTLEKT